MDFSVFGLLDMLSENRSLSIFFYRFEWMYRIVYRNGVGMITSSNNRSIKNIIALQKRGKARKEQDVFIVEGMKMVLEIPIGSLVQLFVAEEFLAQAEHRKSLGDIVDCHGIYYEIVADKVFREITDTQTPQGILAVVRQPHYTFQDLFSENRAAHLVILEGIQDPGNLGTILRAGEGAGVTGVVLSKGTVDIYNPKVIRATMGSIYRVPFLYTDCLEEVLEEIRKRCTLYAAHLLGECCYEQMDYSQNTAFLIGNEANGLREETASYADQLVRIPMLGEVESLNAAVAASILMYEVARQRRGCF